MTKLLIFRERLKQIYSKNSAYIVPAIKFVVTFISLLLINANIGFLTSIKNPLVALFLAAVCSFIPAGIIVLVLTLIMLLHMYALSSEIAIVVFAILLIMYIMYYRFTPKDSYILMLMPVLFFIKIPYVMPLVIGIALTPVSIVSMSFGTIVYYIMRYAKDNAVVISNTSTDSGVNRIDSLMNGVLKDKEMIMILAIFVIITLLVYIIKRMSIDHSWTIAIVTGSVIQLFAIICSTFILDIDSSVPIWLIAIGNIFALAVVYVLQFFILTVDYSRTEYTQFEDDDYYYYVKAVPKVTVTAPEVKVKHINVQKIR